jgi:hypothetical protein
MRLVFVLRNGFIIFLINGFIFSVFWNYWSSSSRSHHRASGFLFVFRPELQCKKLMAVNAAALLAVRLIRLPPKNQGTVGSEKIRNQSLLLPGHPCRIYMRIPGLFATRVVR